MITTKRYIILAGNTHYPAGWADYKTKTDSLEDAQLIASTYLDRSKAATWAQIVDLFTMEVVPYTVPDNDEIYEK